MVTLRAVWRLLRVVLHIVHGMLVAALRFPHLDAAGRAERVRWWSAKLLRVMGLRLVAEGLPRPHACLIVSNHVSWLDIMSINAVQPARFVSKSEVADWPLVGWLVTAAGTLYIERARRRDAVRVVHDMAEALKQGDVVAVFPEGTTGEGAVVMPFHANLLQAAIATRTPVQPVALRYSDARYAVSPSAAWVGSTSLLTSLWWIATAPGLTVTVRFLPPMGTEHADRRALSAHVRSQIERALG